MLIYDVLLYFVGGILLAALILGVYSKSLNIHPVGYWIISIYTGIAAIPIGLNFLPIDPGFDTSSLVHASIFGGVGGVIGAFVGYIASKFIKINNSKIKERSNKFITITFAILGFFAAQLIESGTSSMAKMGLEEIFKKETRGRSANEITIQQLGKVYLDNPNMGPGLRRIKKKWPVKFNKYISKQLEFMREVEREGVTGDNRYTVMTQKSAIASSQAIPFLDNKLVYKIINMRIRLLELMIQAEPQMCLYPTLYGKPIPNSIETKFMSEQDNIELIVEIFSTEKKLKKRTLPQHEFEALSIQIMSNLALNHGSEVYVFTDPSRVNENTAGIYCRLKVDYLKEIRSLENDTREAYFRTLELEQTKF